KPSRRRSDNMAAEHGNGGDKTLQKASSAALIGAALFFGGWLALIFVAAKAGYPIAYGSDVPIYIAGFMPFAGALLGMLLTERRWPPLLHALLAVIAALAFLRLIESVPQGPWVPDLIMASGMA